MHTTLREITFIFTTQPAITFIYIFYLRVMPKYIFFGIRVRPQIKNNGCSYCCRDGRTAYIRLKGQVRRVRDKIRLVVNNKIISIKLGPSCYEFFFDTLKNGKVEGGTMCGFESIFVLIHIAMCVIRTSYKNGTYYKRLFALDFAQFRIYISYNLRL